MRVYLSYHARSRLESRTKIPAKVLLWLLETERYALLDTNPPDLFVLVWDCCKRIPFLVIMTEKHRLTRLVITLYRPDDREGVGRVAVSPSHISVAKQKSREAFRLGRW